MTNKAMTKELKKVLAETYALYLKTQNFHWNVEGAHFYALHKLLEDQYTSLILPIDVIAERIRALGDKVPASFASFDDLKISNDPDENASSTEMLRILAGDNEQMVEILKAASTVAEKENDQATLDMLTTRVDAHMKMAWMLRSTLK